MRHSLQTLAHCRRSEVSRCANIQATTKTGTFSEWLFLTPYIFRLERFSRARVCVCVCVHGSMSLRISSYPRTQHYWRASCASTF